MRPKKPTLIEVEARVLGVLIEKALTTPQQYPLSLNAATVGCNQKSNRDPVSRYMDAEVAVALDGLAQKGLGGRVLQAGSRVEKFRHTANETLELDDARLAVLAELMLRGPQSSGELRARVNRMAPVPTLADLTPLLEELTARELLERLPPAPGSRSERYAQLLAPGLHPAGAHAAPAAAPSPPIPSEPGVVRAPLEERVESLEQELAQLRGELADLKARLGE